MWSVKTHSLNRTGRLGHVVRDVTSHWATTARCPCFGRLFMLAWMVHIEDLVHQLTTMFELLQLLLVLLEALDEVLVVLIETKKFWFLNELRRDVISVLVEHTLAENLKLLSSLIQKDRAKLLKWFLWHSNNCSLDNSWCVLFFA
jgi:hypothetical protein